MNRIKVNIITCFNANHKQKKCAADCRSKIGDTLLDVKPFQNPEMKRPLQLTGLGCAILVCGYGLTGPRINLPTL